MHLTLNCLPPSSDQAKNPIPGPISSVIGCDPDESYHPMVNPSLADTLALWTVAGEVKARTIKAALAPTGKNCGAGTAHIGYQRHRKNANTLVRSGQLIAVGTSDWGAVLYRPRQDRDATAVASDASADRVATKANFAVVMTSEMERKALQGSGSSGSRSSSGASKASLSSRPLSGAAARACCDRMLLEHMVTTTPLSRFCSQCNQPAVLTQRNDEHTPVTIRICQNRACGWTAELDEFGREVA